MGVGSDFRPTANRRIAPASRRTRPRSGIAPSRSWPYAYSAGSQL